MHGERLHHGGFDAGDFVGRLTRWQRDGYLSATGQCLGISATTARALARQGAKVAVLDVNHALAEKVAADIGGIACHVPEIDLSFILIFIAPW